MWYCPGCVSLAFKSLHGKAVAVVTMAITRAAPCAFGTQ